MVLCTFKLSLALLESTGIAEENQEVKESLFQTPGRWARKQRTVYLSPPFLPAPPPHALCTRVWPKLTSSPKGHFLKAPLQALFPRLKKGRHIPFGHSDIGVGHTDNVPRMPVRAGHGSPSSSRKLRSRLDLQLPVPFGLRLLHTLPRVGGVEGGREGEQLRLSNSMLEGGSFTLTHSSIQLFMVNSMAVSTLGTRDHH